MSHIYFIEAVGVAAIKIGTATNVAARLGTLQTGSPFELRVLHSLPGTQREEKIIHAALRYARRRGEWFHRSAAEGFLDRVRANGLEAALDDANAANRALEEYHTERTKRVGAEIRAAVPMAIRRMVNAHGVDAVCDAMQCSQRTVIKALASQSVPEVHRLVGLLDLSSDALDGILAVVGMKATPTAIIKEAEALRGAA